MHKTCRGFKSSSFGMKGGMDKQAESLLKMKFSRLDFRTKDLTPVFGRIAEKFRKEISIQFSTEGAHSGHPWAQLAPGTVRDRVRKGFPGAHPILQRTGLLRDSLVNEHHRSACGAITPRSFVVGTEVEYAKYHQSRAPRTKIPRRAFMFISNQFRLFIVRTIHRFVIKGE